MPVSTADVAAAIRLLLDREPRGPDELVALATHCADRVALRREILLSEDFEKLHPDLALAPEPSRVIVPLEDGVRIVVDLSDHGVGVPIARRAFERNELDFVRRTVKPGWHVVDGGAQAGFYALTMARLVGPSGSVHAFEPVGEHAAWLELGIRESGVEDVVRAVRAALGASCGTGEIVRPPRTFNPGAARLRGPAEQPPAAWRRGAVPVVALDAYQLPRPVSLLRLDVEGAEALALAGATRLLAGDRPVVLVEVHADLLELVSGTTPEALFDRMRALGYTPHALSAGVPGAELAHAPVRGVLSVVFLP